MNEERESLVGPCGLDCAVCELYICGDDKNLYNYLVSSGIPKDKLPCPGCRAIQGKCPVIGETICETYSCSIDRNLKYCFECKDFPCSKLQPSADLANRLPHNMKVFNLCIIKNKGIDEYINQYPLIKEKYYKGKMKIGHGPELN